MSSRRRPAETDHVSLETLGSRLQEVLKVCADTPTAGPTVKGRVRDPPYHADAFSRHTSGMSVADHVLTALKGLLRQDGVSRSHPDFESKLARSFNVKILQREFGREAVSNAFARLAAEKAAAASASEQAARRKARTPGTAPLENARAGKVPAQKQPARSPPAF